MGLLDLFIVALMPVLKTLVITAVGLYLAIDRVNILGPVARHHLNNVVFYVFIPAIVGSSLAETVTASSIASLWFMPVNILLTFIIGSALGWILVKITRTPQHMHGLVIGCCSAGNLGNLLLIIIPAVCEESNSPFGDTTTCSTNGQAYVSLSMAIGAVYIWTYCYNIIRVYGSKSTGSFRTSSTLNLSFSGKSRERLSGSFTEAFLSKDSAISEDPEAPPELQSSLSMDKMKEPIFLRIKQHVKGFAESINLKMVFTPSTIATVIGIFIGVISPIRKLMIGDSAPLRVIDSSASMLGEATIPCMTLIVGANLLRGIGVVKVAHHFGMVGSDTLYQFVLMLQFALPPAMSIGTITQLFEMGESECSKEGNGEEVMKEIPRKVLGCCHLHNRPNSCWTLLMSWILSLAFHRALFPLSLELSTCMPFISPMQGLTLSFNLLPASDRVTILEIRSEPVVFFVFNPALVSSNLAKTVTFESIVLLWFMPINILLTFIIGTALGWILLIITRVPQHLKGLVLGSCAAGNLGNLPLIIIPAVCREKGSPFGAPDVCYTYGMAYASLSMAIGAIYLWSYVYNIIRVSSSKTREFNIDDNTKVNSAGETKPLQGNFTISKKIKLHLGKFSRKINMQALFAPSTTGAIAGFVIGTVSPVRKLMIGDSAPLHVVQDSASLLAYISLTFLHMDAAIPTVTLIVGGNLMKGLKGSGIQLSLIVGIIAVRYVFLPLFGVIIVKGAIHFGLVHTDPLYQFVLLLQFALPPAMNIGTITQLFGAGHNECSVIMLWTYSLASVSLSVWSTFFVWLVA
ncbi:hypothetical protein LguiB_018885 [Lonicera macranthoides]